MIRKFEKDSSRRWALRSGVFAALLALVLLPSLAGAQTIAEKYQLQRERRSQFNLASSATMVLAVNQYQCGLVNTGDTCTDVFDSPTGGGGFWPTGSSNQYMFNSGLQVVGQIPEGAGFAWAGDTVGAFFMDASGLRQHGSGITEIYNSLDAEDMANWPVTGFHPDFPFLNGIVDDTALFAEVLIGRKAASQQDSWVAYWDGDPNKTGGRAHPMGIMVEQRSMAWNYPAGNEASIYFVYKFTNVTNNARFQRENEAKFGIQLPDAGWTFENVYVAFDSDPDVGSDATNNYATAILPFDLGTTYNGEFVDNAWIYPPALFHAPFFETVPGMVGVKYLRSPVDPETGEQVGLTSFSLHTNGAPFNDPRTVEQGWRYVSLNVDAGKGDPACTFEQEEVLERKSCFLAQTQSDVRMFIGSGPFSLGPGQSATIAVMQYAAATVENNPNGLPTIDPGVDNPPAFPSATPGCNGAPIRPIEVAAGWIGLKDGVACPAPGGVVDQYDVEVVPESLLGRGIVAQSIFDNKFLLGFAPETPDFYLVPGDNQVTVVWEPSATEENGDPFFAAAGDPANPLYDPNYRQFDVEGYRVYRGTSPANLRLIAQFDKNGSTFTDVLCMTDPAHITGTACNETHVVDINQPFVQYTEVVPLATGEALPTRADTALSLETRAGTSTGLNNSGIPFAFIDDQVKNGFQYFYKVTAFDINSVRSGPTSLESAAPAKSTMPRPDIATLTLAGQPALTVEVVNAAGQPLNVNAPLPTIDSETGTFSGPAPPTDQLEGVVAPYVARLYGNFTVSAQIDSVVASSDGTACFSGSSWQGSCWIMYTTFINGAQRTENQIYGFSPIWVSGDGVSETHFGLGSGPVPYDPEAAAQFGIPTSTSAYASMAGTFGETIRMSQVEGQWNRRLGGTQISGGSRWFSGANETVADPTTHIRVGHLDGVDSIWSPVNHTPQSAATPATMPQSVAIQCFPYFAGQVARAADMRVTWTGGAITVEDVTHGVPVAFKPTVQASYGFLNDDANGNGMMDWDDFQYIDGASQDADHRGFCVHTDVASQRVLLEATPTIQPVSFSGAAATAVTPLGNGFAMYINGQIFFFRMNAPPADGTVWTLRTYSGEVRASTGSNTTDPSGYTFTAFIRPPMVPGLALNFTGTSSITVNPDSFDIADIHTVPDPYYASSLFDRGPATKELQFVNLPSRATIRIYSMSGVLVDIVNHDDPTGGTIAKWDLRNRSSQFVASGVYFYHVTTPDGEEHTGKFTVINSGFAR